MSREKGTSRGKKAQGLNYGKQESVPQFFVRLFSAQLGFTPLRDEIPLGPLESALESRIISA